MKEKKIAIEKEPPNCSLDDLGSEKRIEDCYGEGEIAVWDRGSFKIETNKNIKIIIETKGAKLNGKYFASHTQLGKVDKEKALDT